VRYVFRNGEGIALPHGSDVLSRIGQHIETVNLLPGDLVFFRILHHAISHVGIYLGKGEFIHASSSKTGSVIVSSLSESYWAKHFTLARRIELSPKQAADHSSEKSHSS
jgi:cell wall-associated NlpC family hydrolase